MSGRAATYSAHLFCAGSTITDLKLCILHPAMASVHLLHAPSLLLMRAPSVTATKQLCAAKLAVQNCASENVRRRIVVGGVVGTAAVFVGAAAVAAVAAAAGAMAASGGGREAAVVATRRGMHLFTQVRIC